MKPLLLDLFCGAGGAAMGYHRAGFDVVGVDMDPNQLRQYPFLCIQGDALNPPVDLSRFHAIHASPPCQTYSTLKTMVTRDYESLIVPVRDLLRSTGLPYVIENVEGAAPNMRSPIRLCGSSLGCVDGLTELRRHRLFESNMFLMSPPCAHQRRPLGVYGHLTNNDRSNGKANRGWKAGKARARRLMGIDWDVTDRGLAEAIPPAYTEFIGRQLIDQLERRAA